jgi:AraC-like DNA-binding protein
MRSSGEVFVTQTIDLSGRFPVHQAALASALAAADLRFLSCRLWRTAADWTIPERVLHDTFIFVPVAGAITMHGPAGPEPLGPGGLALIPHGQIHAAELAAGCIGCTVLALHVHLLTPWGTSWLGPAPRLVGALSDHRRWVADLQRLAGLEAELGQALGRLLVGRLLVEMVLAGHPVMPPAQNLDPRLATIVARVHADPGGAPPIAVLARELGIGPLRLRQLFHAGLGCAPKTFIDRLRLAKAASQLQTGRPVAEVARRCGFASLRQLQVRFKAAYGATPSAWAGRTTI